VTDHVPVEYRPPPAAGGRKLVTEICQACSQDGVPVLAAGCELAAAVLQRTAYGSCPLGCGAVAGDVMQSGDLAGFVRLWPHRYHGEDRLAAWARGDPCIGSNSWTVPLPLAAPPAGERDRLAAEIGPPDDPEGAPLTLF
jgi:hypothetical protein